MKDYLEKRGITKEKFLEVANNSLTCAEACRILNLRYTTYKHYAELFGCFHPNPSGKGLNKKKPEPKLDYEALLSGKVEYFTAGRNLKRYLIRNGLKKDECERCGWAGKLPGHEFSQCELHHKDGNNSNNELSNLEIICPNCHSLTENFRGANMSKKIERSIGND